MEVETSFKGMPSKRSRMSRSESMATPTFPTSPKESWWSESRPIWVGRSKATESPVWPASMRYLKRRFVPGGPEAGVLAHGPGPAAVHRGVDAARVGILAGVAEPLCIAEAFEVLGFVEGLHLNPGLRPAFVGTLLNVHVLPLYLLAAQRAR